MCLTTWFALAKRLALASCLYQQKHRNLFKGIRQQFVRVICAANSWQTFHLKICLMGLVSRLHIGCLIQTNHLLFDTAAQVEASTTNHLRLQEKKLYEI
jgi:hypothetical protein